MCVDKTASGSHSLYFSLWSVPGPGHPSGSAGCISEASSPAAHTVEVSSAAPGEDERWSWGWYGSIHSIYHVPVPPNISILTFSLCLSSPSGQPKASRAKPSWFSAACSWGSGSAAPLLMSDQHTEVGRRRAERNPLPLHSSRACWGALQLLTIYTPK